MLGVRCFSLPSLNSQLLTLSDLLKNFHRGIMPGMPADAPATQCARSAKKHVLVFGLHSPLADSFFSFRKRPGRGALKNVTLKHPQRVLDIDRTFALDTEAAITRHGQAIFQRLVPTPIDPLKGSFFRLLLPCPCIHLQKNPLRHQSETTQRL